MLQKLFWLAFTLRVAMCDCHHEKRKEGFKRANSRHKVTQIGQLPPQINETSGLVLSEKEGTFWTHNDGGNPAEIYEIDPKGALLRTLPLSLLVNKDWEDIAKDDRGNLYLADVGNNANNRRDLVIYKFHPLTPERVESIRVRYANQRTFPPAADSLNFDCEAVVWYQNTLYLFSKNRSKTNRMVKMYAVPDAAGSYEAVPQDSVYSHAMVTGADVSPDGKTLALLTYGKVLLFDIAQGMNLQHPTQCLKIARAQTEAIVFVNNTDFVISNERKGELWQVTKKKNHKGPQ